MQTLNMPDDYDGKVITTVIRREARVPTHKALLYVHGYNDYFFQSQLAQIFNDSCCTSCKKSSSFGVTSLRNRHDEII